MNSGKEAKPFRPGLAETFDKYSDFGLYTLKYHLQDHMVADIRRFGALSVLESDMCKHDHVQIKQVRKKLSKRTRKMMETINVTERRYKIALSYVKKKDD